MSALFVVLVTAAPHHRLSFAEWTRLRDERHARNAAKALANLTLLHSALRPEAKPVAPDPTPLPEPAPKLATAEAPSTNRAAYTMIGVGALALVALFFTRKKKARPAALFTLVGSHRLGAKHSLQVIDVGGHRLLMSVGDKGIALLCSLPSDLSRTMQPHEPVHPTQRVSEETSGIIRLRDRKHGPTATARPATPTTPFAEELATAADRLAALRGVA